MAEVDQLQTAETVKVVVRVRPFNDREKKHETIVYVEKDDYKNLQIRSGIDNNLNCSYDYVFKESSSQQEVYEYVKTSVQQVAQGYNCTIFAYGQTGTGKTYTMLGNNLEHELQKLSNAPGDHWGIIPRSVHGLFEEIKQISKHGSSSIVHCSYMQIYNNEVYDLLQDTKIGSNDSLSIREIIKGNSKHIFVSGVSEYRVANDRDVLRLLQDGGKNRTIRSTQYNEKSSRSHALLQLSIEVESRGTDCATIIRRAKLNLVDLAGSEKWDTDVSMNSERTKELKNINQSLSALGNVISALTERRRTHIPYRDSKLTRLLQDSLGGNTRTIVIATISPSFDSIEETISTLQFADRAKRVMVRVKVNEVVDDAVLLARAQREITRLKLLLRKDDSEKNISLQDKFNKSQILIARLRSENMKYQRIIEKLNQKLVNQKQKIHTIKSCKGQLKEDLLIGSQTYSLSNDNRIEDEKEDNDDEEDEEEDMEKDLNINELNLSTLRNDLVSNEEQQKKDKNVYVHNAKIEEQNKLIVSIQQEKHKLEQQLYQMEHGNQLPQEEDNNEDEDEDKNEDADEGPSAGMDEEVLSDASDNVCPMCQQCIDDHTDEQLDACIALEEEEEEEEEEIQTNPKISNDVSLVKEENIVDEKHGKELMQLSELVLESQQNLSSSEDTLNQAMKTMNLNPNPSDKLKLKSNLKRGRKSKTNLLMEKSKQLKKENKLIIKKTKLKNEENNGLNYSVNDIGLHLNMYKYRYDSWYPCMIVGYDNQRMLHCIYFEYGDKQWTDLSQRKFVIQKLTSKDNYNKNNPDLSSSFSSKQSLKKLTSSLPAAARKKIETTQQLYGVK